MSRKPKVQNSFAERELDKAQAQFDAQQEQIKNLTLDRMNEAPVLETEQQTKLSNREMQKKNEIYLKPVKTIGPGVDGKTGKQEKFNENFRSQYEFAKEYVNFVAENKEIIGEEITLWTKPFGGMDAEMWVVPVNKPVWGPRYLAEKIKKSCYHRLRMEQQVITRHDSVGSYTGSLVVDNTINRLDAYPVSQQKSIFMGASGF